MIRVNVQAFQKAEEYIQEKAKGRMYWLKPTVTTQSIEDIEFPSAEWLESDKLDWVDWGKKFNINTEFTDPADIDFIQSLITDISCILNWEREDYQPFIEEVYTTDVLKEIHMSWINQVVANDQARIEDLQNFFRECLEGKNDRLLMLGTNFDRHSKERDNYIEEDLEETIDLTEEQFVTEVKKVLPPSLTAPEIDELDDEIFKDNGLVAVRDEKGTFLKGQKKV